MDPLSQRKLSSVQSKYLYLEQQIEESNMKLDLEWEEHLDKCKVNYFSSSCLVDAMKVCGSQKVTRLSKKQLCVICQAVNSKRLGILRQTSGSHQAIIIAVAISIQHLGCVQSFRSVVFVTSFFFLDLYLAIDTVYTQPMRQKAFNLFNECFFQILFCFQKRGNNRVRQLETASKETLYRVLVNHTNIIESQKAVLDTIEHEVKELKMRNIIAKGKFKLDHVT